MFSVYKIVLFMKIMSFNILTQITQQMEGGLGKCWQGWQRGEGGLGKCWQWLTKGEGGLDPPNFGWHNLWTAPYLLTFCQTQIFLPLPTNWVTLELLETRLTGLRFTTDSEETERLEEQKVPTLLTVISGAADWFSITSTFPSNTIDMACWSNWQRDSQKLDGVGPVDNRPSTN